MFLALLCLYLIVFFYASNAYARRAGFWHPVTLFGISGFYYYLSVPLELHLKGQDIHAVLPAVFYMPNEVRISIALAAIIALLGYIAGHHLSGMQRQLATLRTTQKERAPTSLLAIIFSLCALLFAIYGFSLFQKLSYHEGNVLRYSDSFFSFSTSLLTMSIGLLAGAYAFQGRILRTEVLAALAFLIFWGFFTSEKNPLLVAAMGAGTIWLGGRSRSKWFLALYCAGALAVTVLLPVFSAIRNDATPDWEAILHAYTLEHQDANGPMMSLSSAMAGDEEPLYGSSYLYALVSWIPRSVWPDRPYDLAQTFAYDNLEGWQPGMGLGYSLLAEGYLNFGYFGIFVQYFCIAFLLNRVWLAVYPVFENRRAISTWAASLSVLHFQLLVTMHRNHTAVIVQTCLRELPLFVFCLWLLDQRATSRSKRKLSQTPSLCSKPL
ncbi:O-antigen polymerase [Adhaeretor mobilis]|uniref:Oligosaccharide repeat unit polymerase n=1 Tax=Adhaeretor mobilis TaxID=1930276 RepID=A0A517MY44_9BACT|nr:O-antigen polymerase [Adhaeretor mobilis]QDS99805.1 hypothetical protein HG15A2_31360 [Adhaeretor mobilis]